MLFPNILAVAAAVATLVSAIPAATDGNLAPEVIAESLLKRGLGRPTPFRLYKADGKRPREPSPSPPRPRPRPAPGKRERKRQVLAESLDKRGVGLRPFRKVRLSKADGKRPRPGPDVSPPLSPRLRPDVPESLLKRGLRVGRPKASGPHRGNSDDPWWAPPPPPPIPTVPDRKGPIGRSRKGPNRKRNFIANESLEKRATNFGALKLGSQRPHPSVAHPSNQKPPTPGGFNLDIFHTLMNNPKAFHDAKLPKSPNGPKGPTQKRDVSESVEKDSDLESDLESDYESDPEDIGDDFEPNE
ncbi:hypothetical protein HYALB_00000163 [Hymenoscyphus albidus]|uniref:Uncharacterized protein n=1 Tax=Hymenoscyphus albidus TaxID=595503 RepID=A0A9N9LDW1_9HELO|nr:hypothetical protein HYALB_00000163 [Hymenoscyphus albidus]